MSFRIFFGLLILTPGILMNPVRASGLDLALHGNERGTPACNTCHGAHGEGMPANGFPRLAGMNAEYLQRQLDAFATRQRVNAMMTPIAQTLRKDERAAVAWYYARLRDRVPTISAPVSGKNLPGERLALHGRWSQGLPACMQCHGAQGAGVGAYFPALAGQSYLYIENQLLAWKQGTRSGGPYGLMKAVASKLSTTDIHAVAVYFSALPAINTFPETAR